MPDYLESHANESHIRMDTRDEKREAAGRRERLNANGAVPGDGRERERRTLRRLQRAALVNPERSPQRWQSNRPIDKSRGRR